MHVSTHMRYMCDIRVYNIYFLLVLLAKRMDCFFMDWISSLKMESVKYYCLLYLAPFLDPYTKVI